MKIPSYIPTYFSEQELLISDVHKVKKFQGDGKYTRLCNKYLALKTNSLRCLITHSCTAALEMSSLISKFKPGDEIIIPSFAFVSTANAFVLSGVRPVFVDIRIDNCNIDENLIEKSITKKTKAIVVLHYAGVACEMDQILRIAKKHNLIVIEDAAQAIFATYKNKYLGSIGDLGTFSFHETKNINCGQGGAILINKKKYISDAEIIWHKGTNRTSFEKGIIDKYSWVDKGSSFLTNEISAASLWCQLQKVKIVNSDRLRSWHYYHSFFEELEINKLIRRPSITNGCKHNAHIYYLILSNDLDRELIIKELKRMKIEVTTHYLPLHNSKGGKRFGRYFKKPINSEFISKKIIRLPLWYNMPLETIKKVCESLHKVLKSNI